MQLISCFRLAKWPTEATVWTLSLFAVLLGSFSNVVFCGLMASAIFALRRWQM
jgi:hypothetical protein